MVHRNIFLLIFLSISIIEITAQSDFSLIIEQLAEEYSQSRKNRGLVIAIIKDGKTEIKGFGKMSKDQPFAPNENTLFEVGSLTHPFTTSLMVLESQKGKFNLEDPVQNFLPEAVKLAKFNPALCVEVKVATGEPHGNRSYISCQPHPFLPPDQICFCDLATHTSGIKNTPKGLFTWSPFNIFEQNDDPYKDYTKGQLYEHLSKYQIAAAPGTYYKYSNTGMALLGNVLADMNKMSFQDLIQKEFFIPLNMNRSFFELSEKWQTQLAPPHNKKGKPVTNWHFDAMQPAAGLVTSASDLSKFLMANIKTEYAILGDAFAEAQFSKIEIHNRKFGRPTWGSYGWFVSTLNEATNQPVIWQNGGTGGYRSFMAFVKDTKTGVIVLSNSGNSVDEIGFEILEILHKKSPLTNVTKTN